MDNPFGRAVFYTYDSGSIPKKWRVFRAFLLTYRTAMD